MKREGYVRNDRPLWRHVIIINENCKRPYFLSKELHNNVLTDNEVYQLKQDITNK